MSEKVTIPPGLGGTYLVDGKERHLNDGDVVPVNGQVSLLYPDMAPDSLDAALDDAVAALPPGGAVELLGPLGGRWTAAVRGDPWMPGRSGSGDTPADALHALAAKLREVSGAYRAAD